MKISYRYFADKNSNLLGNVTCDGERVRTSAYALFEKGWQSDCIGKPVRILTRDGREISGKVSAKTERYIVLDYTNCINTLEIDIIEFVNKD